MTLGLTFKGNFYDFLPDSAEIFETVLFKNYFEVEKYHLAKSELINQKSHLEITKSSKRSREALSFSRFIKCILLI